MPSFVTTGVSVLKASVFVLAFLWLSLAVGRRILRWLEVSPAAEPAERGIVATALGLGALQFVPFLLGAVGQLGPRSLRIALGVVAIAALPDLRAVAIAARDALRGWQRPPRWVALWIVALLPALAVTFLLAVAPSTDPDGLSYHLTVPKRWLQEGWLSYLPTYAYSNTPMGTEMLFSSAMVFAGDAAAKLVHFATGVLGVAGLYLAGKRLRSPALGALAATLYLVGPAGVIGVLGWGYIEGAAALALIASSISWLIWLRERQDGWLVCAALLAGVGVSFKIVSALFPIALGALTVLVIVDARRRGEAAAARTPLWKILPLLAAPVLPWLLRSLIVTGNPVFPLFAKFIPSRDFTPEMSAAFDQYNRYLLWATRWGNELSLQNRKLILLGLGLAILLGGAVAWTRLRGWLARGTLAVIVTTVLVQLGAVGLYGRYWIPILAVMQLPVLLAFAGWLGRRWVPAAIVGLALLCSGYQARQGLATVSNDVGGLVRTAVGLEDQRSYLLRQAGLYPIYEHANRALPPGARILLTYYCGGFFIEAPTYCAEFIQNSLRFTVWDEFTADLSRLGITHVVAPRALATGGPRPDDGKGAGSVGMLVRDKEYELVSRLLRARGRLLESALDQGLYALDGPAQAPPPPDRRP